MPPRLAKSKSKSGTKQKKTTRETSKAVGDRQLEDASKLATLLNEVTTARVTEKYVLFWGGILSNWWLNSPGFSGARCFELILPRLDALHIPHPPTDALMTRLMRDHVFNCGEQWMMAMKGWLFEPSIELSELVSDARTSEDYVAGGMSYESLRVHLLAPKMTSDWKHWVSGAGDQLTEEGQMYESTVCKVLRSKDPGDQKRYGRHARGFDPDAWKETSVISTIAACVARAEVDVNLREIYLASDRHFVEGSPKDKIWGVGLHWKGPHIENEKNWKGENRLGKCHDEAARQIKHAFGKAQSDDVWGLEHS